MIKGRKRYMINYIITDGRGGQGRCFYTANKPKKPIKTKSDILKIQQIIEEQDKIKIMIVNIDEL